MAPPPSGDLPRLAAQLHDLKRRHGEETDQVIVALEQAATRLEQLLDEAE